MGQEEPQGDLGVHRLVKVLDETHISSLALATHLVMLLRTKATSSRGKRLFAEPWKFLTRG
jgi:hypothetical protein